MKAKNFVLGALAAGGALAAARLLFARPAARQANVSSPSQDAIDAYIEDQMRRLNIPGAALAIVEGDRIVRMRGFTSKAEPRRSLARPGGAAPTPQTPFFIGSLTKSFTALAVMQLAEAGKVELDAPIRSYLPWFRTAPPQGGGADPDASAQMTVRHLLNQTSGLPLLPSEAALADFDKSPDAIERQVRALSGLPLSRPPGEQWEYSNFNYNILGLIVQTVSGETYPGYVQKHIFNPLEMRHSYTSRPEARQNGLAMGYRHWFSLPFPAPDMPVPLGSLPSGQLISSAEDIAHYLIAHLNGGRYGTISILSEAGIQEMHQGVTECMMFGISAGKYGMGWFDMDLGGMKIYSHGGNVPDFSAFMALIPGQKKGVVMLFNADPYGMPPVVEEVGLGVTALLAGQRPAPIQLDFLKWIMRCLPLIPLLQIAGAAATLRLVSRWRRDPASRPRSGSLWGRHIILPLLPNLGLTAALVYLKSRGLLTFFGLFMPDVAWIARISAGFAAVWACLRTIFVLRSARNPGETGKKRRIPRCPK